MAFIPNIFLIGEVSSGKSSFLNAMASGFVSCVSLQRETFGPSEYNFRSTATEDDMKQVTNSLEDIHKDNEKQREMLTKDSKMPTSEVPVAKKYTLPSRHGLPDMNLYDFPGLNDSEDKGNKFTQLLKDNIHKAHLVIFITDATKAFSNASELDTFIKVRKLIESEFNNNYHYVELIIVVNKYDDMEDDDLRQIYERISQKVTTKEGINATVDTFKLSSHKMLINSLIARKGSFYVPTFLKVEAQRILKNGDIMVPKLMKRLKKNAEYWNIDYTQLELNDDSSTSSCDSDKQTQTYDLAGDWMDIVLYLKKFNSEYFELQKTFSNKVINDVCAGIETLHDRENVFVDGCIKLNSKFMKNILHHVSNINKCIKQINGFEVPCEHIQNAILRMCRNILHISMDKYGKLLSHRYIIFEILCCLFESGMQQRILDLILDGVTSDGKVYNVVTNGTLSEVTALSLLFAIKDSYLLEYVWSSKNGKKMIMKLLSDSTTYSSDIPFSENNSKYCYHDNGTLIETEFNVDAYDKVPHSSWFIQMLLSSEHVPKELKYVVYISVTSTEVLKLLYTNGDVNKKYLDNCQENLYDLLKLTICVNNHVEPLEEELFSLHSNTLVKSVHDEYNKTKSFLEELV